MNHSALSHPQNAVECDPQTEDKQLQAFWTRTYSLGGATLVDEVYAIVLWLVGLVPLAFLLDKAEAAGQRKLEAEQRIALAIRRRFPGVKITPQVPIEGTSRYLDLFVELPEQRFFLILIRAPEKGVIFYNEEREVICLRRGRKLGITYYDRPDLISEAKEYEHWIRKNRRDLFGGTSRGAKRPALRLLVIAQPTQIRPMPEHLYDTVNNLKVPFIRNSKGSTYLLLEEQLCKFLAAK
jgi:hypothetical protein